ncbi:carboxypeptidase-like regulatory domain-containing protein, partial [Providencia stuartii]|uniref:carboxypeptidase-like regulatory domain-containing protein n=1 Tax=Providencia stuartii TaxID=588 RepID=UPI0025AB21DC
TSVNGFVKASKGSFLSGAAISIKNESTGFVYKGISNLKGFYQVTDLPLGGPYTITASFTGYGTVQKSGYTIAIGENLKIDFELSDQVTELKEVVITARKDIYSRVSPVGTAKKLGTQEIKVIPANSRNF